MAEHHAGLSVEARQAADDALVVREGAVAMQLVEIGEQLVDIVQRVRALGVARDLRDLPRAEAGVDVLGELQALLAQPFDLVGDVDGRLVLHVAQFVDLALELGDWLLELQEMSFAHGRSPSGDTQ